MDLKALKELAKACRLAGIKSYKSGDIEFTLADEAPTVRTRKKRKNEVEQKTLAEPASEPEQDALSESELLFWSSHNPGIQENQ